MALLTKEQILTADDKKRQLVHCPEWGGDVYVRTMTGTERDAFEQAIVGDGTQRNWQNVRARLAALTVTGDNGKRLFTDADVGALGQKSAKTLDRIFGVASRKKSEGEANGEKRSKIYFCPFYGGQPLQQIQFFPPRVQQPDGKRENHDERREEPHDDGNKNKAIPYYLPQPYLLITKDFSHIGTKTKKTENTTSANNQKPVENTSETAGKENAKPKAEQGPKPSSTEISTITEPVSITVNGFTYKIIYLPNLAEKYGLVYNSGSGESDISFTLKDGWMFTGLNLKSDAQIDETITAMSSLIGSIAKIGEPLFWAAGMPDKGLEPVPEPEPEVAREPELEPAIWLFKMTFDGEEITFDRVSLNF